MESLPLAGEEKQSPGPTEQDRENERIRREVAERFEAAYREVLLKAFGAFGPGWEPSCRHFLVDKEVEDRHRREGAPIVAAATVYTVKNPEGRKRHFTVGEDGLVKECDGYEQGFGEMLLEPHPTMRIEVRGEKVAPHHYSLCFAPYELYHPKTAEQLAALRETRERKKLERAEVEFAKKHPLFVLADFRPDE